MSTDQPSAPADDDPVSGNEPALSDNCPVPRPVTGDEPTLSGNEGLLHALEMTLHQDRQVRYNAVSTIESFKDVNTLDRLLNILADSDQNLRNRAAWALIRFGDDAAPGLLDAVQSSNQRAREEAAWAMSMMELPSFVPELIALLEDGESEDIEDFIVQAICRAGTDAALAHLVQYLEQYQQEFIPGLYDILEAFKKANYVSAGPVLLDILPIVFGDRCQIHVIDTLAALNHQPACDVFLHIAKNPEGFHPRVRQAALRGLHTFQGDQFIPHLIQLFNDGNTELKRDIMVVLAGIDVPQAAELIRAHLRSDNASVQQQAIRLAGNLKDVQSVLPLIELLSDTGIQVRNSIVRSLGQIGDERAVPPLKNILDNLEMVWLDLEEQEDEPWVQSRDYIVPALRSIGTLQARQIVKKWESENPEPPPAYWDWYI